ncbi:MAG: hypothetical protein IJ812_03220, partial [Schwartzia sp.]|nr:hypothetical protein [Schwartzia sp. (in: firmicutes)]
EFERLLYASFYKDIFFAPVRKPCVDSDTDRLMAAGFENRLGDLDTEAWMVQATRSSRDVAALKAEHTPELRKKLATLLRRIEYEIDTAESVAALWALVGEAGFTADYLARFVAEMVVHRERFLAVLSAASPEERRRDIGIIAVG